MSSSRSACQAREAIAAIATSARAAATSPIVTWIEDDGDEMRHVASSAVAIAGSTSWSRTSADRSLGARPPVLDPDDVVGEPPRLLHVVRDDHGRDRRPGAQALERRLDRVACGLVERRGGLVEEQDPGVERERSRQHDALLLADRELGGVAVLERRVEAGQLEAAARVEAVAGEARPVGDVVVDRAVDQRRELGNEADLAAERQGVALADVLALVDDRARSGSASRLSSLSSVDLPLPEGPTTELAPTGNRALRSRSTSFPERA